MPGLKNQGVSVHPNRWAFWPWLTKRILAGQRQSLGLPGTYSGDQALALDLRIATHRLKQTVQPIAFTPIDLTVVVHARTPLRRRLDAIYDDTTELRGRLCTPDHGRAAALLLVIATP